MSHEVPTLAAQPRFLRLRDAPAYLGLNRNAFNEIVRPYLTEIPIGTQGIAFDRLDLDAWADDYKRRNGRPGVACKGASPWDVKGKAAQAVERRVFTSARGSGTSTKSSEVAAFAKALARVTSTKRKNSSPDA